MTFFTWENVNWFSQFVLVVFAGVALVTGTVINKRQNREVLELRTKLSQQEEKTERAKQDTLGIERLIKAPRKVINAKADEILDWGDKGSVYISWITTSDEAGVIAEEAANVLDRHGWTVTLGSPSLVAGGLPAGITMSMHGESEQKLSVMPDTAPGSAKVLYEFLSKAIEGNISVEIRTSPQLDESRLTFTVGPKY